MTPALRDLLTTLIALTVPPLLVVLLAHARRDKCIGR